MHDATRFSRLLNVVSQILACGLAFLVATAMVAQPARAAGNAEASAVELIQAAIKAGMSGDVAQRHSLLQQAIQAAPDYAPARWESGQIRVQDRWLPVAEAQAAAKSDPQLQKYRELRAATPDTPSGHLELARWCRRAGLDDEARYHWWRIIRADPKNKEALVALDMVWHEGELVTTAAAEQLRDAQRSQLRAQKHWKGRIAAWERALAAGGSEARAAIDELHAEVDASAILAFEKLAAGIEAANEIAGERQRRLCTEFLSELADMPSFTATQSLARFAVLAPEQSLRNYAVQHLAERSVHETVPLLLRGLQAPVEDRFDVYVSPHGTVTYTHELRTADSQNNYVVERHLLARTDVVSRGPGQLAVGQILREKERAKRAAPVYAARTAAQAENVSRQIQARNQQVTELNGRISEVLEDLTGERHGTDPVAWWDYWNKYNEYKDHGYRPTLEDHQYVYDTSYIPVVPTPALSGPVRPPHSCFVAGTMVWTKIGLVAIETIEVGDLVLSHDVRTDELAYRPVLLTTTNESSSILRIVVNDHEVHTTSGHPFWVAGTGWRMAKELAAGDSLLTVDGPVDVSAISPARESKVFNLVVEGASDYFVGEPGILVHDNTPRRPELVQLGIR